jgi:microcystin-dependent protein
MPAHTHAPGSTISEFFGRTISGSQGLVTSPAAPTAGSTATASTGGGGAHNNLQPYLALQFIIKT